MKLDRIDKRILAEMQANGRISNLELADKVGLSPTPCSRRVAEGGAAFMAQLRTLR